MKTDNGLFVGERGVRPSNAASFYYELIKGMIDDEFNVMTNGGFDTWLCSRKRQLLQMAILLYYLLGYNNNALYSNNNNNTI